MLTDMQADLSFQALRNVSPEVCCQLQRAIFGMPIQYIPINIQNI